MPLKKDNRLLIYDLDSLASSPSTFRLSPSRPSSSRPSLFLRLFSLVPSILPSLSLSLCLYETTSSLLERAVVPSRYLRGSSKSRVLCSGDHRRLSDARARAQHAHCRIFHGISRAEHKFRDPVIRRVTCALGERLLPSPA